MQDELQRELLGLQRRVRRLQLGFVLLAVTGGSVAACGAHYSASASPSTAPDSHATFDEVTVQRLNVREPDGTLRLVLSSAPTTAAPRFTTKPSAQACRCCAPASPDSTTVLLRSNKHQDASGSACRSCVHYEGRHHRR